jgi:ATP-dependent Clp protease ATP-binding subunit ClpA
MFTTKERFGLGRVYLAATEEAKRRGDRRVGTEHLALALLIDPESVTAQALGVSLASARTALQNLDRQAIASLGIELGIEAASEPVPPGRRKERLRLTPAAKGVFTSLGKAAKGERLGIRHVLVVLMAQQRPDPAAELLDALEVDRAAVRMRLQASS